ncbi:uncharacterized protein LOC135392782 [Ornithodoros turicata]|uniref:uncharacterized protein LOC135392782 n=1 Tax=Ornithodoros turicata TaxID=34597 RepID=UPI00313918FD
MNRGSFESPKASGEMRPRTLSDTVPEIAVVKGVVHPRYETPIIPDSIIYYGSGAIVVLVFLGLCIMAYMLIFHEGGGSHDLEDLYKYL